VAIHEPVEFDRPAVVLVNMSGVLRGFLEEIMRDVAAVHHSSWSTEELADIARAVEPSCVIVDTTYLKPDLVKGFVQFALQNNWTPIVGLSLLDGSAEIYAPAGAQPRIIHQISEEELLDLVRQGPGPGSPSTPGGNHGPA